MSTDIARQPKGIPAGGQFAATAHTEPDLALVQPDPKSVTDHFLEREAIADRRQRLYEQLERMDRIQAAHSLRSAAATILARFPGAVTFRISEDPECPGTYEPKSIANADGGLLELNMPEADYNDDWVYEQMVEDGPDLRDLVQDLSCDDDHWTQGVGFVHGRDLRKTVDINLQAALSAPDPFIAVEHDPRTRTLSAEDQEDLVEAANHGVTVMEDILEANSFDDYRQREAMEDLTARVNQLLTVTRQD